MLQPSPRDIHIIIPFNSVPLEAVKAQGNSPETLSQLLNYVQNLQAGGGTDIYTPTVKAMEIIGQVEHIEQYFPSVILMTDGKSQGIIEILKRALDTLPMGYDIPIHSITFGEADETQLKQISELTIGRVFHGDNLVKAFREARGYN